MNTSQIGHKMCSACAEYNELSAWRANAWKCPSCDPESEKKTKKAHNALDVVPPSTLFFRAQNDQVYAQILVQEGTANEHWENCSVPSTRFKSHATGWLYDNGETFSDAKISSIEAYASHSVLTSKKETLWNRVGVDSKGNYWWDLSNERWEGVLLSPEGLKIMQHEDIFFMRQPHHLPMEIDLAGTAEDLHKFVELMNLSNPEQKLLFSCYLPALLHPRIVKPISIIEGPEGAAKSSVHKAIRLLIDNSETLVLHEAKKEDRDLMFYTNYCIFLDNVKELGGEFADAICRAVTGDGSQKRKLYSNDEVLSVCFMRAVGLNGINAPSLQADFIDRTLRFELNAIEEENRLTETEFLSRIRELAPKVRGYLAKVFCEALRIYSTVELTVKKKKRLAGFHVFAEACSQAMGNPPMKFSETYSPMVLAQSAAAVEGSLVGRLLLKLLEGREEWEGTSQDLYGLLTQIAAAEGIDLRANRFEWPANSSRLSRKLHELQASLGKIGWKLILWRTEQARGIRIERKGKTGQLELEVE